MTVAKQPPCAVDAEASVLGSMMAVQESAVVLFGLVAPEDFYIHAHQVIARAIHALHEARKPHDLISVSNALRDRGDLEDVGGVEFIGNLALDAFGNAEPHAKIVRDRAMRRKVIALCHATAEAAYSADAPELTGMLSGGVEQLLRSTGVRARKFAELLGPTEAYLNFARERRRAGGTIGVPTGLPGIDKMLGGLVPGRLYGIAARPGFGKTALLNQIAFHAASRDHGGLISSIEMGAEELVIRGMAAYSGKNVGRMFHGYDDECSAAISTGQRLGHLPLWIDADTSDIDQIISQIATMKHRNGISWAAIDHVGLVQTRKFQSRNDQIGHITGRLKQAAKHLQMPLIALFQLSRLSEKENRRPGLHDLRDSGNIEQDLDVAMFLHVDVSHRDRPQRPVHLGVLKNRSGRSGWLDDSFEFDGGTQTFRQITTDYDAPPPRTEVDL